MSVDSALGRGLSMFMSIDSEVLVELKATKHQPFVAKVKDFVFGEEETRVEFTRIENTVFPDEEQGNASESYITYMKNITSVERIRQ